MITWAIPDLDLANQSLWLNEWKEAPVFASTLSVTINSIPQIKLKLKTIDSLIDGNKIIGVVELFDGWEVSVLPAHVVLHD